MSIIRILRKRGQGGGGGEVPTPLQAETTTYMNALGIADDATVYYATTPQEITGSGIWTTVNDYIFGLKQAGLWTKVSVDYPIIGGTAARHAINIKDPSLYVVNYVGAWVHNELGALGNGTSTYANTGVLVGDVSSLYSNGLSYLSGTDNLETIDDTAQIGAANSLTQISVLQGTKTSEDSAFGMRFNNNLLSKAQTGASGFWSGSRTSDTVSTGYKNGVQLISGNSGGQLLPTVVVYFGGANLNNSLYGSSKQRIQNASIHQGLTGEETLAFYDLLVARETALGRKTW